MLKVHVSVLGVVLTAAGVFAAPAAGETLGPEDVTIVRLGREPAPEASLGQWEGGALTLQATGREAYMGRDEATFAGFRTDASNFTFVARVVKAPSGTPNPKYGVTVRDGLSGTDKCFNVRYDGYSGNRCIQWFMRYHVAPSDHDGARRCFLAATNPKMTLTDGFWLRLRRRYPFVDADLSEDGRTWVPVDRHRQVVLAQTVWVGVMATAGGSGRQTPVVYDHLSFTVGEGVGRVETRDAYQEYHPPVGPYEMTLARTKVDDDEISPFVLMPKGYDRSKVRAILWSAGSKEVGLADGTQLAFEEGKGSLRRPKGMEGWEGTYEVKGIRPFNQILAHCGLVRVGGAFHPKQYRQALRALAEATGIRELPNLPFVVTGASFAGGYSAQAAALYPEQCVASAPVVIGMAGAKTADEAVLRTPHLHVYGSRDGVHLRTANETMPRLREKGALWANGPMWMVAHRQHKADAIIYPYFLECLRLRLPEKHDYAKGPNLKALREEDGWFGLAETWETSFPEVVPVKDYKGDSKRLVWLPTELTARIWQAFVSFDPRTVIHFPMFEGRPTYGGRRPHGWHNSYMEAGVPWELVASGPLGDDLKVEYYAGLEKLEVLKVHGSPYRVTLGALPPGLHAIYAITTVDGIREISRPVTVLFQKRR